jgi:hypothetical protein
MDPIPGVDFEALSQYRGLWVAIDQRTREPLGSGATRREALEDSEARGHFQRVVIVFVPEEHQPLVG